ncbi:hypothetical protein A3B56_00990 [Candidatus Roizmanbacteria bacterium RIFCSPLOWO2_01_FULL_45_11]|uniref:dTDP-4-dehydrorhamnose reductase n=1 Tax=Candidatus Roizmanbacteria bacterium RIFCSPLOWO2_01_FULL_45_11 TaxID=1802070 RepID=A0A1F7JID2_9BACT|nr:MAG: hypothetical protein A3B56_00990 [Candidatus Roizmanbacteria bacterium RIFCSPLOWO2_01_FULL_45_11]
MNILGTGLSGMVGSRIVELLSDKYTFQDMSLDTGVDIRNIQEVRSFIEKSDAPWVLHAAAMTDVDGCEKMTNLQEDSPAFQVNVTGTKNVVDACKAFGKRLLYISTDFVFDGKKETPYTEEDKPNPVNYYGYTKYLGEQLVEKVPENLIVRITYPYGAKHLVRKDFVQRIAECLSSNQTVQGVTDMVFTPTLVEDIAHAIDVLVANSSSGIYHVVGSQSLSPYEAALAIASVFGYDKALVQKIGMDEFYREKAPRPQYLRTSNKKIGQLGITMKGFEEGLRKLVL